ncbi:MAG: hypothetical protein AB7G88_11055, partial [Thermomicrobiales bacterium]
EEHAGALISILRDTNLASSMGLNGHIAAQRFSWETVAAYVIHVYRRLAEGHSANLCCDEEIFA